MLNMHFELNRGACFMLKLREQVKDLKKADIQESKDKLQTQVTVNSKIIFSIIML